MAGGPARTVTHTHVHSEQQQARCDHHALRALSRVAQTLSLVEPTEGTVQPTRRAAHTHSRAHTQPSNNNSSSSSGGGGGEGGRETDNERDEAAGRPLCLLCLCLRLCSTTALFDEQTTPISFRCSAPPLRPTLALCFGLCGFPLLGRQAP